jgi:hypothetical protein
MTTLASAPRYGPKSLYAPGFFLTILNTARGALGRFLKWKRGGEEAGSIGKPEASTFSIVVEAQRISTESSAEIAVSASFLA